VDFIWRFLGFENLEAVLNWGGYPVLMLIIFAETGLLVGFFLPGDSLLVTTGVLIQAGLINPLKLPAWQNLMLLNVVLSVTAIIGDAVGYSIGRKAGPKLFTREQSLFFRKDYLLATQKFYEAHGGKTIILARFMPFARTFAPVVAGIGQMSYARFALFNVAGAIGWIVSMSVLGFVLGKSVEAKSIEKIVILIVIVSVTPPAIGAFRAWRAGKKKKELEARQAALGAEPAAEPAARDEA
jgi:membrane-associated protein